jgi:orotidine-5'-phosphate decarboxylase
MTPSARSTTGAIKRPPAAATSAKDRLIVALDVSSLDAARRLLDQLTPHVGMFKVGKELFTAEGPAVVREIVNRGSRVFLDLKYHDIPTTVERAVAAASGLGVSLLTVHASGGRAMMEAAASALPAEGAKILGITVLTSHTDETLWETGVGEPVRESVRRLAKLAYEAGVDGVVCSPLEIALVRETVGRDFLIVTPGVRPRGAPKGDQARVMTPREARDLGCSYVVVGRPITEAKSPESAARAIVEELE